jgi:hypothetical protein
MQDRFGQFCFAWTIATNRIDVYPAPTMLSVRIVAYALSAVHVVMIWAPSMAS